jgi:hypothetical protein
MFVVFSFGGMAEKEDREGSTKTIGEKWNNLLSTLTLYTF